MTILTPEFQTRLEQREDDAQVIITKSLLTFQQRWVEYQNYLRKINPRSTPARVENLEQLSRQLQSLAERPFAR